MTSSISLPVRPTASATLRKARTIALLAVAVAVAGCADTLSSLRTPPTMSPMSGPKNPIDPDLASPTDAAAAGQIDAFDRARLNRSTPGRLGGARHGQPYPGQAHLGQAHLGHGHAGVPLHPAAFPRAGERSARASLWSNGPQSLFDDRRARTIGDIVTILIEIDDQATINNSTTRSRSGSESLDIPDFFGLDTIADTILPGSSVLNPGVGIESSSATAGDGAVTRDEQINLRIAATVVDVKPNGHLVVTGSQEVRVNFELRDLQVAGVIRPEDISRKNTITYDKIANARISYGGRGIVTDLQRPRYGQQFIDSAMPF